MLVKCKIHEEIKSNGAAFFRVTILDNGSEVYLPISPIVDKVLKVGDTCDLYLKKTGTKNLLFIPHPKYNIDETYRFFIKKFDIAHKKYNGVSNIVILDVDGNEVTVSALEWHKEEIWNHADLFCKVIGYQNHLIPSLIIDDDRHPFYSKDNVYSFEVVSFVKKYDSKIGKERSVIIITDHTGCNYSVLALPNQENSLKAKEIIECRVLDINTRLYLRQENIKDPFFYKFEDIIDNNEFKINYFSPCLIPDSHYFLADLKNQYDSQSAFWVFTYCNILIPKMFYESINKKQYKDAIKINELLHNFEDWILKSNILMAFNDNVRKSETQKKSEQIISISEKRKIILLKNINNETHTLFSKDTIIDPIFLYEVISLTDFEKINEIEFIESIENILKDNSLHSYNKEIDLIFFNKIANLIESKKKIYVSDIKEEYFVYSNSMTPYKVNIQKFLLWTYCQLLIYRYAKKNKEKKLTTARLLKFLTRTTENISHKKTLLYYAFYTLIHQESESDINLIRNNLDISIDKFDYLTNPNLTNVSNKSNLIANSEKLHKVNITERYYNKGYKIELNGVVGFLPIHSITDTNLKRYPFDLLNWETNVYIHLHSEEFNFFVAKQPQIDSPHYLSNNLITNPKDGEVVSAKVTRIEDYGIFVITPYGDALLHKSNISDQYWDKRWLDKYFKVNENIFVVILKYDLIESKIEVGFSQLIGTLYENYYYDFLFSSDLSHPDDDDVLSYSILDKIEKEYEIEKGYIFEQFAILQDTFEDKIKYIKISKQFFANADTARSYLSNVYIEYFTALLNLSTLLFNYSFESYDEFRLTINKIKDTLNQKTIDRFEESENLIFFIDVLSVFNKTDDGSNLRLIDSIYSILPNQSLLKSLAKITLANNLLLSEVLHLNNEEAIEFSQKNLKRIRDYILKGYVSLSESEEDRLTRELKEKQAYYKKLIQNDEGESLEFKSSFIEPIPSEEKIREIKKLKLQLESSSDPNIVKTLKKALTEKEDEIHGAKARKKIIHSALKTIAAFANTRGGILLIGVSDTKHILGLKRDYDSFPKKEDRGRDGFGKFFDSKIKEYFGESFSSLLLEKEFLEFPEGDILIVKIQSSRKVVFLLKDENGESKEILYTRNLSSSEKLEGRELAKFILHKETNNHESNSNRVI